MSDGRVADDSDGDTGGSYRGLSIHMDGLTSYDVLWNERQKAIAKLKEISNGFFFTGKMRKSEKTFFGPEIFRESLASAIDVSREGVKNDDMLHHRIADRLIHLLGGDQPSGIDVLRAMDERETEGRITDELREFVGTFSKRLSISVAEVNAIADRIDAQFDRICEQQEAVLQKTVDEMVKEYEHDRESDQLRIEKLEKQRDHWRQQATDMMNHADAMEHERDEAYARTDELSDELLRVRRERDELRAKMAIIREAVDG